MEETLHGGNAVCKAEMGIWHRRIGWERHPVARKVFAAQRAGKGTTEKYIFSLATRYLTVCYGANRLFSAKNDATKSTLFGYI
jgi:hypothetical protein